VSPTASRLSLLRDSGGFFALESRIRIRLTGQDRLRYLNGQVSNDLRKLAACAAMNALVLSVKGKLCADIFVWSEDESLIVEADQALAESLLARLERYAIADDVAFEILPEAARYHAFGSAAGGLTGIQIRRMGVEGVDLWVSPPGLPEAAAGEIQLLRIERGVPQWGRELTEETLPQEAGLEKTAVDFHKGCYVGQEVVSRIQSVGHANRHLCGFLGDFDAAKAPSVTLRDASGNKVGWLTSSAFHPQLQKTVALGYLNTRAEGTSFSLSHESGACLGLAERSEFPLVS
jgi:folate-binding protein YgfZ